MDTVRDSLERDSDQWFRWLIRASVLVGVGVAFEAWEATITLKRWWLRWREKEVGPENEKSWAIPVSYLGLVLVVAGVIGEGICEFGSSNAETKLRFHDEQILADTTKEAGAARQSAVDAGNAAVLASAASVGAVSASKDALTLAKGARTEADSFAKGIASAKRQAADAEIQLAAALERTAKLEKQLSWRTVTPEQTKAIKSFVAPFRLNALSPLRNVKIRFTYLSGNEEAAEYAEELATALRSALDGLSPEISEPGSIMMIGQGPPLKSLILQVANGNNQAAGMLQHALKSAGIDTPGEITGGSGQDINFFVGVKPDSR